MISHMTHILNVIRRSQGVLIAAGLFYIAGALIVAVFALTIGKLEPLMISTLIGYGLGLFLPRIGWTENYKRRMERKYH